MDDRQSRLLLILGVLLVGLVGLIVFVEPPKEEPRPGDLTWETVFSEVQADAVTSLRVKKADQDVRLERNGPGQWTIHGPDPGPAANPKVEGIVTAMARLQLGPSLPGKPVEYGLDPATVQVEFTSSSGSNYRVEIGDLSPTGDGNYLSIQGGPPRLSRSPLDDLWSDLDFRSRLVSTWNSTEVVKVQIQGPGRGLSFELDENGWWVSPSQASTDFPRTRASGGGVEALVDDLANLQAKVFHGAPIEVPADRALQLKLEKNDGSNFTIVATPADDGLWLVSTPLQANPVSVQGETLENALSKPPMLWFEESVVPMRPSLLESLEVELDGLKISAKKAESGWDEPRSEGVLGALERLKADRSQGGGAAADAPATGKIRLQEKGGRVTEVQIFGTTPDGRRSAAEPGHGAPFLVDSAGIDLLKAALLGEG